MPKCVSLSGRGSAPGPDNDGGAHDAPKSPNRLGIGISPPFKISPISLHRRCRRLDLRRSLPCMIRQPKHVPYVYSKPRIVIYAKMYKTLVYTLVNGNI